MTEPTRSPIKDKPLRLPGQSLMEERAALWEDKLEPWALMAAFFIVLAGWEWFRYFRPMQPNPILVSACALAVLGFAGWRLYRLRPRMRALKQGIDGEKAVGQFLERLRELGYHVFHDLIGESFNVDHVLIGPAGAFTIETKTWSKPQRGDARIAYDGDSLIVGGREPSATPSCKPKPRRIGSEPCCARARVDTSMCNPSWCSLVGMSKRRRERNVRCG